MDVRHVGESMPREVKLSELEAELSELDYPLSAEAVCRECEDVTLQLADGTEGLSELIANSGADRFDSPDELSNEIMSLLPRHAVGEPYQSEGEG